MIDTTLTSAIVALMFSAAVILFLMAATRSFKKKSKREKFEEVLESFDRTEFDSTHNADVNLKNPWTKYWYNRAVTTGTPPEDPKQAGRAPLLVAVLGGLFGALVFPGGAAGALIGSVGGIVGIAAKQSIGNTRRMKQIEKQLPSLLSALRSSLQSNSTPSAAIVNVADMIPAPLGNELNIIKDDIHSGIKIQKSMNSFASRVQSKEISFFVSAFNSAVESGSDLEPPLAKIQDILSVRESLASKLSSAKAAIKPTLWVANVAIPLGFLYSTSTYGTEFWSTGIGIGVLIGAAVLWGINQVIILRLTKSIEKL